MTVRQLARYQINYIEYLLSKTRFKPKPFEPIELKRGLYIIDVPLKKTVIGHINGKRNTLVVEFWEIAIGIEAGSCCYSYCKQYGMGSGGRFGLSYGYGTGSTSWTECNLQDPAGGVNTQSTIGILSDRTRVSLIGVLPNQLSSPATEVGVIQPEYIGGDVYAFMIARVTGSWSGGTTIVYYIDYLQPWTSNFAYLVYSFNTGSGVTVTDTSGNSISTAYNEYTGSSIMIGSVNSYTWSPTLYSITEDVVFNTSHSVSIGSAVATDYILGTVTPSQTMQIQTLGLVQNYTSGSSSYPVLIFVLPLPSPITLYANQLNQVYLRLVAD